MACNILLMFLFLCILRNFPNSSAQLPRIIVTILRFVDHLYLTLSTKSFCNSYVALTYQRREVQFSVLLPDLMDQRYHPVSPSGSLDKWKLPALPPGPWDKLYIIVQNEPGGNILPPVLLKQWHFSVSYSYPLDKWPLPVSSPDNLSNDSSLCQPGSLDQRHLPVSPLARWTDNTYLCHPRLVGPMTLPYETLRLVGPMTPPCDALRLVEPMIPPCDILRLGGRMTHPCDALRIVWPMTHPCDAFRLLNQWLLPVTPSGSVDQ